MKNVSEQKPYSDRAFEEWKEHSEQVIDVTVIGIRI